MTMVRKRHVDVPGGRDMTRMRLVTQQAAVLSRGRCMLRGTLDVVLCSVTGDKELTKEQIQMCRKAYVTK